MDSPEIYLILKSFLGVWWGVSLAKPPSSQRSMITRPPEDLHGNMSASVAPMRNSSKAIEPVLPEAQCVTSVRYASGADEEAMSAAQSAQSIHVGFVTVFALVQSATFCAKARKVSLPLSETVTSTHTR